MTTTSSHSPAPTAPTLQRRGFMLVLTSPPAGGKTTIARAVVERDPQTTTSTSATTRDKRPGEVEGEHYHFIKPDKFQSMIDNNEMLEYALVYNNYLYGTPKEPVEEALAAGKDVIFDIDWQGKHALTEMAPADVVSIFLLPPSWKELEHRLRTRAQDTAEEIVRRLNMAEDEISHYNEFQYVIVNTDLEESITQVQNILSAERLKRERLTDLSAFAETLKPV